MVLVPDERQARFPLHWDAAGRTCYVAVRGDEHQLNRAHQQNKGRVSIKIDTLGDASSRGQFIFRLSAHKIFLGMNHSVLHVSHPRSFLVWSHFVCVHSDSASFVRWPPCLRATARSSTRTSFRLPRPGLAFSVSHVIGCDR